MVDQEENGNWFSLCQHSASTIPLQAPRTLGKASKVQALGMYNIWTYLEGHFYRVYLYLLHFFNIKFYATR